MIKVFMWFLLSFYFALWNSVSVLIVKRLSVDLHPKTILLVGNTFVLPFLLIGLLLFFDIPKALGNFYLFLSISSALDVVAFLTAIWAVKLAPISLIAPISAFNPVFTTIIAALTTGELPTTFGSLGIVLIVAGAYLLNFSAIRHGVLTPLRMLIRNRGVQLTFVSNFLWAVTPIFQKQAILSTEPITPLFASMVGYILVTVFALPLTITSVVKEARVVGKNLIWFLFPAPLNAVAFWAAFTAFSQANVGYVTAIFKLSILFTIFFGWLFFKEEKIRERLLGASVMLAGTIILVI